MLDLSLCFFHCLCFLECFESESESDDEVPEDSPSGSSDEWSEDASDMSRHCLFCSGSWNHGWLFFCFLDVLDCLLDCTTGAPSPWLEFHLIGPGMHPQHPALPAATVAGDSHSADMYLLLWGAILL